MLILNFKFSKESTFKESFIPISWASIDIFRETDFLEDWYFLRSGRREAKAGLGHRDKNRYTLGCIGENQVIVLN